MQMPDDLDEFEAQTRCYETKESLRMSRNKKRMRSARDSVQEDEVGERYSSY